MIKTVYDPEIPVNVYDLGLIYRIEVKAEEKALEVDMTLTAPIIAYNYMQSATK